MAPLCFTAVTFFVSEANQGLKSHFKSSACSMIVPQGPVRLGFLIVPVSGSIDLKGSDGRAPSYSTLNAAVKRKELP